MSEGKRLNIIIYILIIVLIILVVFVVINRQSGLLTNKYTYTNPKGEDFTFAKTKVENITMHILTAYVEDENGLHQYTVSFRNNPYDLEDIYLEPNIKNKILNKKGIFMTLNPNLRSEAVVAAVEISRIIGTNDYGVFKIPTQSATTMSTNTTFPVRNCKDATQDIGVILLGIGNYTRVFSNKECTVVEGDSYENLIRAADRLALHLLNVM